MKKGFRQATQEGEYVIVDYELVKALKGQNTVLKNIYHRNDRADLVIVNSGQA